MKEYKGLTQIRKRHQGGNGIIRVSLYLDPDVVNAFDVMSIELGVTRSVFITELIERFWEDHYE